VNPDLAPLPAHFDRSITDARVALDGDGNPILEVLCDCGNLTLCMFEQGRPPDGEWAFTCDGCVTVHWVRTIRNQVAS
jgi:hypothetical protein